MHDLLIEYDKYSPQQEREHQVESFPQKWSLLKEAKKEKEAIFLLLFCCHDAK